MITRFRKFFFKHVWRKEGHQIKYQRGQNFLLKMKGEWRAGGFRQEFIDEFANFLIQFAADGATGGLNTNTGPPTIGGTLAIGLRSLFFTPSPSVPVTHTAPSFTEDITPRLQGLSSHDGEMFVSESSAEQLLNLMLSTPEITTVHKLQSLSVVSNQEALLLMRLTQKLRKQAATDRARVAVTE